MDGLTASFVTVIVTVVISFLVAVIVRLITAVLGRFAKPQAAPPAAADTLLFRDESDIASVIAIALTLKK
jgi:Na+-transporting methylmalonyl-CoA/oxaloacetate decarboxylase gamma subunit